MDIKKDSPVEIPKEQPNTQDILYKQPISNSIGADTQKRILDLMSSRDFDTLKVLLFDIFSNLDKISNSFFSISPVFNFNLGSRSYPKHTSFSAMVLPNRFIRKFNHVNQCTHYFIRSSRKQYTKNYIQIRIRFISLHLSSIVARY